MPQTALKYDIEVTQTGRVQLPVPFQIGAHLTIFVISEPETDNFDDLLAASQSRFEDKVCGRKIPSELRIVP